MRLAVTVVSLAKATGAVMKWLPVTLTAAVPEPLLATMLLASSCACCAAAVTLTLTFSAPAARLA